MICVGIITTQMVLLKLQARRKLSKVRLKFKINLNELSIGRCAIWQADELLIRCMPVRIRPCQPFTLQIRKAIVLTGVACGQR